MFTDTLLRRGISMAVCFVLLFICGVNALSESASETSPPAKTANTAAQDEDITSDDGKMSSDAKDYEYYFSNINLLNQYNNEKILVIGHKSPDTDTVCSAIAYAALLRLEGYDAEPRTAGKINNETKFVLESFDIPVPEILENAAGNNIIIVDHNDLKQCVDGILDANVIALVEHHALSANPITNSPIFVITMPVGAAATVVSYIFRDYLTLFDKQTAGLLISAILSDTDNLTSPTTTVTDMITVNLLNERAGIDDLDEYYKKMHKAALSYDGMTDKEAIYSDWKDYLVNGHPFSIFSMKSADTENSERMMKLAGDYITNNHPEDDNADLFGMFTDEEKDETWIIPYTSGAKEALSKSFSDCSDGKARLPGSASRKMEVYPPLADYYSKLKTENAA